MTTWQQLRNRVLEQFLSACETLKLQTMLEATTQHTGETIPAYVRRFKAEAQRAYTTPREGSEEFRVVSSFLRGLRDRHFAERVFRKGRTGSLQEVTTTTLELEAEREKMDQMLKSRGQEMMEVDSVGRKDSTDDPLAQMQRQLQELTLRIARSEQRPSPRSTRPDHKQQWEEKRNGRNPQPQQRRQQRTTTGEHKPQTSTPYKWTRSGQPICSFCERPGHIRRDCRRRNSRTTGHQRHPAAKRQPSE